MSTKICTVCNEPKTLDQFSKDKRRPDGCTSACKGCAKAQTATYRTENPEKIKAYGQAPKGKYATYKASAKKRGISFYLTFDQFETFWQADCNYCGDQIATVGIDRIDSNIGYTIKNCVPCCWECNRIKGDRESEPLNMHLLKMLKHQRII